MPSDTATPSQECNCLALRQAARSRAQLKQGKLGRPARARWDSHQHLLRV